MRNNILNRMQKMFSSQYTFTTALIRAECGHSIILAIKRRVVLTLEAYKNVTTRNLIKVDNSINVIRYTSATYRTEHIEVPTMFPKPAKPTLFFHLEPYKYPQCKIYNRTYIQFTVTFQHKCCLL